MSTINIGHIPESIAIELAALTTNKISKIDVERKELVDFLINLTANSSININIPTEPELTLPSRAAVGEIEKLANGYIKQWPWNKKIKFVLTEVGTPLTGKQIANYILSHLEPELKAVSKRVTGTISGQLTNMIQINALKRDKNEVDDFEYSLMDSESKVDDNNQDEKAAYPKEENDDTF